MRISDWSSDVCSSDLRQFRIIHGRRQRQVAVGEVPATGQQHVAFAEIDAGAPDVPAFDGGFGDGDGIAVGFGVFLDDEDRKSVVEGKGVSVRVDLGGLRIIKKTQRQVNYRTKK